MALGPDDFSTNRLSVDAMSMEALKLKARQDPRASIHDVAQQFESMFLQMVLKTMRESVPQDGLMDSETTRFYTSMLDQQLAQKMAASGQLGLAKVIEQQLSRNLPSAKAGTTAVSPTQDSGTAVAGAANAAGANETGLGAVLSRTRAAATYMPAAADGKLSPAPAKSAALMPVWKSVSEMGGEDDEPDPLESFLGAPLPALEMPAAGAVQGGGAGTAGSPNGAAREFVNRVWPYALEASRATGVPAHFLVAHAALETGWGRSEPRRADGSLSHNLFGIKAGKSWQGAVVEATTTEYVGGVAQQSREPFRAYASYADSFRDYANLLQRPRYAAALGQKDGTEFAKQLQQAGYATDPMYAEKLARIIHGPTLRQALSG